MSTIQLILLGTIFLPLAGVGLTWAVAPSGKKAVRWVALAVSLVTLAGAAHLAYHYSPGTDDFATVDWPWMAGSGIEVGFHIALDGISLWLFALSALLSVTAILVSWKAIEDRPAGFYGLLLLLETGMLGVFAAQDIILFYVFFEFTLIPLFFLIGIWGSEDRRYAAVKFFLFTLAGSLLTFLGLLAIVLFASGDGPLVFSIRKLSDRLAENPMPLAMQCWIFAALFAGFAIKVPLFPLHTWLPLAHVQAPTAGSVILAGVLLKMGIYGFVRFSVPMLGAATAAAMPWMLWLAVAGIVYGALVALAQSDMKRLVAYSSVSHLGYCMLGIFALNPLGMQGGMLQAINHGLSTGGLFAIVGMLYERYHTRKIADFSGLARRLPLLTVMMVFFTFASIGLPGLNGFAGEVLVLIGMFQRGWSSVPGAGAPDELAWHLHWISVLAVSGVVLGAWYMLWLVQRVFFGPLREPVHDGEPSAAHATASVTAKAEPTTHSSADHHGAAADVLPPGVADLSGREFLALAPLCAMILWIGLWPNFFLERMTGRLDAITTGAAASFDAYYAPKLIDPAVPKPPAVAEIPDGGEAFRPLRR
jgi:NADH-quinone oxidoreductase subunit M